MRTTRIVPAAAIIALLVLTPDAAPQAARPTDNAAERLSADFVLPGIARPHREVITSAPLDGVIRRILVREGDTVRTGEPIALMDDRIARAAVASARAAAERSAALRHAQLELDLARSTLTRLESTSRTGATAQTMLEEAQTRVEQARAGVESAAEQSRQADLNLVLEEQRLEMHTVRAPFDGEVLRVLIEEGSALTTSTPIAQIASMTTLRAEIHLPAHVASSLARQERYELLAESPIGTRIVGSLEYAEPVIDPATRTRRCVFSIQNDKRVLPAGFGVQPLIADGTLTVAPPAPSRTVTDATGN